MKDNFVSIHIRQKSIIFVFILCGLAWLLYELRDLLLIVICAVIFALALEPGKRFLARFRIPGPIAVVLLYIFAFSIILFLLYSLVPILLLQYQVFLNALPNVISLAQDSIKGTIVEPLFANIDLSFLASYSQDAGGALAQSLRAVGGGITSFFGGVVRVLLFLLLTFLFAAKPESLDNFLKIISPAEYEVYVEDLWKRTKEKMGHWFKGQMALVFIIGSLTYFALLIVGVPNALFLGVFAGVMELLPIFGPLLGAIPAILMAASTGNVTLIFLTIGIFIVIQQLENNLVYPLVVNKVVGISSVLVILAIVVGGTLAGFIGIVIAVPVAAILQEFVSDLQTGRFEKLQGK